MVTIKNRLFGKILDFYVQWSGKESDEITYGIQGEVSTAAKNIDAELSLTSTNPVQNRAITNALNLKLDNTTLSDQNTFGVFQCYLDKSNYQLSIVNGEGKNV